MPQTKQASTSLSQTVENQPSTSSHHGAAVPAATGRIEIVQVDRLTAYKGDARTHSRKEIRKIADSIERFGFVNPALIDDAGEIIAGHGRVEAAKLLGITAIPCLRISHLSDAEKRAYILADNRLAELAGWDREILAIELPALPATPRDGRATARWCGRFPQAGRVRLCAHVRRAAAAIRHPALVRPCRGVRRSRATARAICHRYALQGQQ
jgi:hypothetical protein